MGEPASSSKGMAARAEPAPSHTGPEGLGIVSLLFGGAQFPDLWCSRWLAAPLGWLHGCLALKSLSQHIPIPNRCQEQRVQESLWQSLALPT